ncbi:polyketide synthase [Apiospora aurea]|uniref:Polyketide synthase n=1 Tax=Apiospora aurea TaxID=335848 RepID=A0ABR1PRJ6_9PEZI
MADEDDLACIVGMACRLPGGIRSPSEMWSFMVDEKSAQGRVPADRFNIDGFYSDTDRSGVMSADGGYFLQEDVRQFENRFFGINNIEAKYMDPQQRKLLEVVYECFENAGLSLQDVAGSRTGVYVGNFTFDHIVRQARDLDYTHRYCGTGSGTAILANRISHLFDLRGPSVTLDTGCSASLYGFHAAVSALRAGECDAAVVASANLITSPEQLLATVKGGVISQTSTCHTFDAEADGYGRAEAVNAIYLKTVCAARRDRDGIWAIIRGTSVNSDGRTPGISHPSVDGQVAVIRSAYATSQLEPRDIDYVECHGTGTAIGDPIEVEALRRCFSKDDRGSPLVIGSVKPNFGHSEAASGLTSVIKVALALRHAKIPPTYGVKQLNPKCKVALFPLAGESQSFSTKNDLKVLLDPTNMAVATELSDWPRRSRIRRAGVSAFGYGGSNAHCVLESFDRVSSREGTSEADTVGKAYVLPLSAFGRNSLEQRLQDSLQAIGRSNPDTMEGLAYTLGCRRTHFQQQRAYVVAQSHAGESCERRRSADDNIHCTKLAESPASNSAKNQGPNPIGFVFTGQGAQYATMARELLGSNAVFRKTIRELDKTLQSLPAELAPAWSLESTLRDEPEGSGVVHQVVRSQPLCTAVQIGLVRVLRSWGIEPAAVVGHSSGEIAAAYAAGLVNAGQAILAAYFRGYVVGLSRSRGAMAAVGLSSKEAEDLIAEKGIAHISVACVNAPQLVTLSGSSDAVDALVQLAQDRKVFCRRLETGGRAYHSPMMKEVGAQYESLLAPYFSDASRNNGREVEMFSTVHLNDHEPAMLSADVYLPKYWRENLEKPVQFLSAVGCMTKDRALHLIEIGPHSALKGPIQAIRTELGIEPHRLPYDPTLVRGQNSEMRLKELAGELFLHGHRLDWEIVNEISRDGMVPVANLPTYPWDYSTGLLWDESRLSIELRQREFVHHELLGSRQLGTNGIDWTWRNILNLAEVPWLRDHKIEKQIVFPAVGYLTMVMVAMQQVQKDGPGVAEAGAFDFRNVKVNTALVLEEEGEMSSKEVELHTTVSPRKLSSTTTSSDWLDFTISSWMAGKATLHCNGSVRLVESMDLRGAVTFNNTDSYETWSMDPWYEKLAQEGLPYGPVFKVVRDLRTDRGRVRTSALSSTVAKPLTTEQPSPYSPVDPLAIEACVQAAIFGGMAGNLYSLRAYIPTFITECRIGTLPRNAPCVDATIHSKTTITGVSSHRIYATLRDPDGKLLVHMGDVLMNLYTGKRRQEPAVNGSLPRFPLLLPDWKPDILRLDSGIVTYIDEQRRKMAEQQVPGLHDNNDVFVRSTLLDLASHKNPRMRVLELSYGFESQKDVYLNTFGGRDDLPRYKSWNLGTIDDDGVVTVEADGSGPFDLILIPHRIVSAAFWQHCSQNNSNLLSTKGLVISSQPDESSNIGSDQFTIVHVEHNTLLAMRKEQEKKIGQGNITIVVRQPSNEVSQLAQCLLRHLENGPETCKARFMDFSDLATIEPEKNMTWICLLEAELELLATIADEDLTLLKRITNLGGQVLWLTGTDILGTPNPDLALSGGLSRALALEQPSLRFCVLDVGRIETSTAWLQRTCHNVVQAMTTHHQFDDKEFVQKGSSLYINRFCPEQELNSTFRHRIGDEFTRRTTIAEAAPARLAIAQPGLNDSIYFQQETTPWTSPPPAGFVDVDVKAVSLNAKDVYVLAGRAETRGGTTMLEFAGVVAAAGPDISHVRPGDRVLVVQASHFGTRARVPARTAFKMRPDEEFTVMATLPIAYNTALYALNDRASLRKRESVLVHAGSGAFGMAAISIAQRIGTTVYTTASTPAKKQFLTQELGIEASHIFNSRDESFVAGLLEATGGRGVDVMINSLTGDLLHAGWRCLANFGRFVEVGKRDLQDAGKLDMDIFLRNATFTAFDLTELACSDQTFHQEVFLRFDIDNGCNSKMNETLALYRSGQIKAAPSRIFDVEDIAQAYNYFSTKDRVGKVVISLEKPKSIVQVVKPRFATCFDLNKTYILIGCLGGLGRSLSRWMVARGARNFVFLGRTGCDKPEAADLVSWLRSTGSRVAVVRGDVSNLADVEAVLDACGKAAIGGVIQAAMGLHETLFYRMNSAQWHAAVRPKFVGTWNIHRALENRGVDLDFMLLTSSVSGSVGSATESNYCAANAFLDAFAHWRSRSLGKPTVAIGLGMIEEVGYLHENPDIKAMLLRKGLQPFNEEEFLQVIDLSLSGEGHPPGCSASDAPSYSQVVTGLEPLGIRRPEDGMTTNEHLLSDPRLAMVSALVEAHQRRRDAGQQGGQLSQLGDVPAWMAELPAGVAEVFMPERGAGSLEDACLRLISRRFARLILTEPEQIDDGRCMADFGIDSMIAAEFRTWMWTCLRTDVPFLDIMSPQKTLRVLAGFVAENLAGPR